jgi:PAS domain S-box-containing protein
MSLLPPLISTTLASALLLCLAHGYLLRAQSSRALYLWTAAWLVYSLRFVAALALVATGGAPVLLWFNQAAGVLSGLLLLWGALAHTRGVRSVQRVWLLLAVVLGIWLTVVIPLNVPRPIIYTPVFVFLAAANVAIAVAYLSTTRFTPQTRAFIGTVFMLWALHKLDYPILRGIPEAASWGYAAGAVFTMAAGVGLLTAYLEEARQLARSHQRRFESLVESLDDVVFTLDAQGRYTGVYGNWADRLPVRADLRIGQTSVDLFGPEAGRFHLEMAQAALGKQEAFTYEWSYIGSDGSQRHMQFTLSPVRRPDGPSGELVGIGRDITHLKQTQLRLERSLDEKAVLLREVHHRVKNNLQIIVSLLRLQSQDLEDGETQRAFRDTMARVASMAEVHERLYESDDLVSLPFVAYVRDLGARILELHAVEGRGAKLRVSGSRERLDLATAIPLGLIVTELISNAAKHALRSRPDGLVTVTFETSGASQTSFALTVTDNGPGLPPDFTPGASRTLGMALVSSLCDQLGAALTWESGAGASFRVTAPVEPRARVVDVGAQQ